MIVANKQTLRQSTLRLICRSLLSGTAHDIGAAAEVASEIIMLSLTVVVFKQIAADPLGIVSSSATTRHLLGDLGRRISGNCGDATGTYFLFSITSIMVQCFSAVIMLH